MFMVGKMGPLFLLVGSAILLGIVASILRAFVYRKSAPQPRPGGELTAAQPHGEEFPWPKGATVTAVDEVILELPLGLFGDDLTIGEGLRGPDDMEINIPVDGQSCFLRLKPGMSVSLAKAVISRVVSEDKGPRRIKMKLPPNYPAE